MPYGRKCPVAIALVQPQVPMKSEYSVSRYLVGSPHDSVVHLPFAVHHASEATIRSKQIEKTSVARLLDAVNWSSLPVLSRVLLRSISCRVRSVSRIDRGRIDFGAAA